MPVGIFWFGLVLGGLRAGLRGGLRAELRAGRMESRKAIAGEAKRRRLTRR
jgi:hypothetical protein